ncbi:DUF538 domain-containing protein [Heracleum sosnowskyi]|uniref:DUF538 domain-containing protein n=1 Tax=Heracleum sosnowskyi TaxID=360622 RepID=A0AAD8GP69_9APIA|nr:DUF538 domain-containing protein [Heracleum sosnowskyi]
MDQVLNKVGSYWFNKKASKELSSVGDDFNSVSSSIEGGTKWLVNKIKGKMQKPLPELLKEYDLPVVGYRDSSVLRFLTVVTGYLEKGKLADIEGIKTKVMIWTKVTCISCEGPKLQVTAGMKKTRKREAYEVLRDGIGVDKF